MAGGDYLSGIFCLGVLIAAFAISAGYLRSVLLPGWQGVPAILGTIVLGLSLAIVTAELLGLLGLLTAPTLMIASVSTALGLHVSRLPRVAGPSPPGPPAGRLCLGIAAAAAMLTAVHWAGPVLHSLDVGIYRQDSTWYHLPFAAWFAQTGSVAGLLQTDPLKLAVWYYPLNSELLHSIGMVVLGNDLISPLLNFGWMGVALLAAWCIGRPLGLAAATLLGTAVVVDSDMMLVQAGNAPSDIVALACLLAAIAVLFNGQASAGGTGAKERRSPLAIAPGPLAVAALAAGLAIGAKVTMLVPVGVMTMGLLLTGERGGIGRRAAIWLGGLATTGGLWYLRNLLQAGNPLPWLNAGPLPGPNQEALYPRPAHSIAEYVADRHAWTHYFLPGFSETLGPLWFVVLFAAVAGIVLGLRRRHSPLIRMLALTGAATLVAHAFNPISASGPDGGPYGFASNLRYAAPGIAIGLVLLPLCETRWMARRVLTPAYALLILVASIASTEWIQPQPLLAIAIGALAVAVPIWLMSGPGKGRRALAIASLLAIVAVVGYPTQRHYFDNRYRSDLAPSLDNPGFRASNQWKLIQTWARDQRGMRIGIVGTPAAYGQYVLYGEDLSNEVRYLGEPQPHGGLTQIESCRRWRERIDNGRFDAVVITPEDPGSPFPPPQIVWTAGDGAAVPVLRVNPAGVFLLAGPLNAAACQTTPPGLRPPGAPGRPLPPVGPGSRPLRE
ncbi:MAG TPA: hypothetical protein VID51_04010 [Solirubrobacterales bacterium]|jgi:hypothetical protein